MAILPPKPTAPCKDCPKKGCGTFHEKCQPYLEYRKQQEIYKEAKNQLTSEGCQTRQYIINARKRYSHS